MWKSAKNFNSKSYFRCGSQNSPNRGVSARGGQRGRIKGPGGKIKRCRAAKKRAPNRSLGRIHSEKCPWKNFHFLPAPYYIHTRLQSFPRYCWQRIQSKNFGKWSTRANLRINLARRWKVALKIVGNAHFSVIWKKKSYRSFYSSHIGHKENTLLFKKVSAIGGAFIA